MGNNGDWVGNDSNWEVGLVGAAGSWFSVFGDIDDFIFYDNAAQAEEEEPRSAR